MRVTNQMISDQVVRNLGQNINRFMKLENMMSTGRRINNPSDDPIGTVRDLGYRSKIAQYDQFAKNISHAKTWLSHVDLALSEMNDLLISAKEIAVSLANDSFDANAREAAANEIESIFEQILQAGNAKLDSRYLFSGQRTLQSSFRATGVGVVYEGDSGNINVEVESGARIAINLIGSSLLTKALNSLGSDADLNVGVEGNTLLSDLHGGNGIDLSTGIFNVTDENLGITVPVDVSASTDLDDVIASVNAQLAAGGITNVTAELGPEGNNLKLIATDRAEISLDTSLDNINSGTGVDLDSGVFEIHNTDHTTSVMVNVSSASTIGEVITEINSQLAAAGIANVTASLNPAGTGLQIQDANAVPLGLSISEADSVSGTAGDLGIVGDISPNLVGSDLNPRPEFSITDTGSGSTVAQDLGITGNMNYALVGTDLDPILIPDTLLSSLNNGLGFDLGEIQISQGDSTTIIDLGSSTLTTVQDVVDAINSSGLDITAAINSTSKGISITNNDDTKTLIVKDIDESKAAHQLGIAGSPDVMGSLLVLIDALREDDAEVVRSVIEGVDSGRDGLLDHRAAAGARVIRLETTELRSTEYRLNFTKLLSETEDADITKLVADLAQQESLYTAALQAASKIIQPSLLDFIR
ncbi:MAG: flagellar hook-associated protein FlgL [candidate division Zixibacteria bacterium]|nr:flagellar hook-associated protein FlgL [candidate division Zixibacteria bacterium]MBU1469615.1 flagellar hook-associated protein FlgL [candidate division Zixibacteria bacterium]MBU2625502.1 flagellar hook-associated protein FlgL [candidate division Zixibacteria bacterium]